MCFVAVYNLMQDPLSRNALTKQKHNDSDNTKAKLREEGVVAVPPDIAYFV